MFRLNGIVAAVALAVAATVGPAAPAARDDSTVSVPADGTTVAALPARVTLTFARPPVAAEAHMLVLGPDGRSVNLSDTPVTAGRVLEQPVSARGGGGGGEYTIAYRVVFTGGGQEEGVRRFTVAGAPNPAASHVHNTSAAGGHSHDIDPVSVLLLTVDGGALLIVAFLLATRRRGSRPAAWRLPTDKAKTATDILERNHHDRTA